MDFIKVNKKRVLLALLAIFVIIGLSVSVTLAWFTAREKVTNVVTLGQLGIKLTESSLEADALVSDGGIIYKNPRMPGDTVSKIVETTNTGDQSVYLRYVIKKGWYDSAGNLVSGTNTEYITLDGIDESEYVKVIDGDITYYYLKLPLAVGETNRLFDRFNIEEDTTNDHMGLSAKIIVSVEGVQVTNGMSAVSSQGWHVIVNPSGYLE